MVVVGSSQGLIGGINDPTANLICVECALRENGAPKMSAPLVLWFLYTLAISLIAAYVAARTLTSSATFLQVCRIAGAVSFVAYAGGGVQAAIWMGKPWKSTAKDVADALIHATATALVLAWLWPR